MRLQSDPTIIYGLFGGKGKPADRPIYQSDIDKPTPYNTYVDQRPAAGTDRQSGRGALEARRQSVEDQGPLFRCRRHRRARLRRMRSTSTTRTSPAGARSSTSRPRKPPAEGRKAAAAEQAGDRKRPRSSKRLSRTRSRVPAHGKS